MVHMYTDIFSSSICNNWTIKGFYIYLFWVLKLSDKVQTHIFFLKFRVNLVLILYRSIKGHGSDWPFNFSNPVVNYYLICIRQNRSPKEWLYSPFSQIQFVLMRKAVLTTLEALGEAPLWSRFFTMFRCPMKAATWRGVRPDCEQKTDKKSTSKLMHYK